MTTELDLKRDSIDPVKLADCYCTVYEGEPWNQEFKRQDIQEWIVKLNESPNTEIETIEQDDKVVGFYIAQRDTLEKILPTFNDTFPVILSTPIGGKRVEEKYLQQDYKEELNTKINKNIEPKDDVLYMLDIGILPEYRVFKVQKRMYDIMNSSVGDKGYVLAQTMSYGPMADLIKKVETKVILDEIPIEGTQWKHIIFTFKSSNFPRR